MPRNLAVVVTMPRVEEGQPAARNTFAIRTITAEDPSDEDAVTDIAGRIDRFYNTPVAPDASPISVYLSNVLTRAVAGCTIEVYDRTGKEQLQLVNGKPKLPSVGSPIGTVTFGLAAATNADNLPEEVAARLTLRAVSWETVPIESPDGSDLGLVVDRPRQKHTGALLIGPLEDAALGNVTQSPIIDLAFQNRLHAAANRLSDELFAFGYQWSVWSRVDGQFRRISHVQTQTAPATVRKRGRRQAAFLTTDVIG